MKRPEMKHVKFVLAKGAYYGYFNTGKKDARGNAIRTALGRFDSPNFSERYAVSLGHRNRGTNPAVTVSDLIDRYENSGGFKRLQAGSKRFYRAHLKHVRQQFGDFPVGGVKRAHVQEVVDNRLGDKAGTKNGFLSMIQVLHSFAESLDLVEGVSPSKHVEAFEMGGHSAWPAHALEAGLESEHGRTRLAVHLLYFTGARIGDAVQLRWSDIRDGWLYYTQQKTKKAMQIPLHSALRAELEATPKRGLNIITNQDGDPMGPQVVRRELKRHGEQLGLHLVPHGLRKNAVNALLEAGCTVAQVAAITGQSFRIVEQYARDINQREMAAGAILNFEAKGRRNTK